MSALSDYAVDWQQVIVLLFALERLGEIPGRSETMEFIQGSGLLDLRPEDQKSYPSCNEPSWRTDIAWARKHAVMLGFVNNHEWNSWEIARQGREHLQRIQMRFNDGSLMASRCFLFSPRFKGILTGGRYVKSEHDSKPPPKGERTLPSIAASQTLLKQKLRSATLNELALRLSGRLGVNIPATEPSVAFALYLRDKQFLQELTDRD